MPDFSSLKELPAKQKLMAVAGIIVLLLIVYQVYGIMSSDDNITPVKQLDRVNTVRPAEQNLKPPNNAAGAAEPKNTPPNNPAAAATPPGAAANKPPENTANKLSLAANNSSTGTPSNPSAVNAAPPAAGSPAVPPGSPPALNSAGVANANSNPGITNNSQNIAATANDSSKTNDAPTITTQLLGAVGFTENQQYLVKTLDELQQLKLAKQLYEAKQAALAAQLALLDATNKLEESRHKVISYNNVEPPPNVVKAPVAVANFTPSIDIMAYKIQSVFLSDNIWHAILYFGNKYINVVKGDIVNDDVVVDSIDNQGVVLRAGEKKYSLNFNLADEWTQSGDSDTGNAGARQ